MSQLRIKEFKGLYTEFDQLNNPGAVDLLNVDVRGSLKKSKGFKIVNDNVIDSVSKIVMASSTATAAQVRLYTSSGYTAGDIIGIPDLQLEDTNANVKTVSAGS